MQVATIVPQNYLHLLRNDSYLMCLGNLIDAPGMEQYTEFYKNRSKAGKYVIMDNGLIEGNPRPITELYFKALSIGADEMIMSDVFCDKEATLKAIEKSFAEITYNSAFYKKQKFLNPEDPRFMLVPQGRDVEEWIDCAHELLCEYGRRKCVIGVPKVLVHLSGRDARAAAITGLLDRCPMARHITFHLLGCWTTPLEITILDKLARQQPTINIRGVDSAMPFVYARAGKRITDSDRPDSKPINFEYSKVNPLLLRYNIYQWRRAANSKG